MKPFLERVPRRMDASWSMLHRRLDAGIPFQWHHHPEFELTLTLNSRGQRFVGDHVGSYEEGDLVLVGPNLAHTWHSVAKYRDGPHTVFVLWFRPEWVQSLAADIVELRPIGQLFARASASLAFSSRDFGARTADNRSRFRFVGAGGKTVGRSKRPDFAVEGPGRLPVSKPCRRSLTVDARPVADRSCIRVHSFALHR